MNVQPEKLRKSIFRLMTTLCLIALIGIVAPTALEAATCTSGAAGSWTVIPWTGAGCVSPPSANDDIVIAHDVNFDPFGFTANTLTVNPSVTFDLGFNSSGSTFTVSNGATINSTIADSFNAGMLQITGGILDGSAVVNTPVVISGDSSAAASSAITFNDTFTVIDGVTFTNNGTTRFESGIAGGGFFVGGGAGSTTRLGGGSITVTSFDPSTAGHVVDYVFDNPTVRGDINGNPVVYSTLQIRQPLSFPTAVMDGPLTVNGTLWINEGHLDDGGFQISAGPSSILQMDASRELRLGSSTAATTMPSFGSYVLDPTSEIDYQATPLQTMNASVPYENLRISNGRKAFDATSASVAGQVDTSFSSAILDLAANSATLTIGGGLDGSGTIDLGSGELLIGGDWCMTAFDCNGPALSPNTGTVTYNGLAVDGLQQMNPEAPYHNLNFANTGVVYLYYFYPYSATGISVDGNLTLQDSAVVDLDGLSFVGNGSTSTLTMQANSELQLGDDGFVNVAAFPTNFVSNTLDPTSTVSYDSGLGVSQSVATDVTYGNLVITAPPGAAETKLVSGTATTLSVAGDLSVLLAPPSDTVVLSMNGFDLDVGGDVLGDGDINFGISNTNSMTVGGTWAFTGALVAPQSMIFTGASLVTPPGRLPPTLTDLTISGGTYELNSAAFFFSPSVQVDLGATLDLTVGASSGTLSTNSLTLNGTIADSVAGTVQLDGSMTGAGLIQSDVFLTNPTTASGSLTISRDLSFDSAASLVNNGTLDVDGNIIGSGGFGESFTAGSLSTLLVAGASGIDPLISLDFTTSSNLLVFDGAAQLVPAGSFDSLQLSGSGTKTPAGNVNLAGDLTVDAGVTLAMGANALTMNGAAVQTVDSPSLLTLDTFTIQNDATLTAGTSVLITNLLALDSGVLTINPVSPLTLDGPASLTFASGVANGPIIKEFDSAPAPPFTFPFGDGTTSMPVTVTVDSISAAPAQFQIEPLQVPGPSAPAGSLSAHWQITPTNILQADLTFTYDQSDVTGTESEYVVARWDGVEWIPQDGSVNTATNTATVDDVTQFSPWTLVPAAACTVVTTGDTGAGTLRQAILDANAGTCNAIDFSIAGPGPHTISLQSDLLLNQDSVTIDGFSQTGASVNTGAFGATVDAIHQVRITQGGTLSAALQINGSGNTVRGLWFDGVPDAILVFGTVTDNNVIAGNLFTSSSRGVVISSGSGNVVGGPNPADRNVFDTMSTAAVQLDPNASVVKGNYIGFDATGAAGSGNTGLGILVGGSGSTIDQNVVSNSGLSTGHGIEVNGTATTITNNRIGTNLAGTAALPNGSSVGSIGIALLTGGSNSVSGNLISGHDQGGFSVYEAGILVDSSANDIFSNLIGTDISGAGSIPNGIGILFDTLSTDNVVGGGLGPNTIMNNLGDGIAAIGGSANKWIDNVISANGSPIPIDLGDDGVDTNDAGDGDTGPNGRQNHPTITSAVLAGGTLYTTVSLDSSSPNPAAIRVEIVESDLSRNINAPLGSVCVAGSVLVNAPVNVPAGSVAAGTLVAALATSYSDAGCTTVADGSSELGDGVLVVANTPPTAGNDSGSMLEDGGTATIAVGGNDGDAESGVSFVSSTPAANGTANCAGYPNCTYTPNADFNGTDSFTYTIADAQGATATATVTVTVTAVNDAPSFVAGANVTVAEDSGAYSAAWATSISAGPADESSQTLTFLVSSDNAALFSSQPAIDAAGNLTFTPATDTDGSANVTVTLMDNGGTANGGVDTSGSSGFMITVSAVNDTPVADPGSATLNEDGSTTITLSGSDADGDSLTFAIATGPSNGTLSAVTPTSATTADVTYTPDPDFNGTDSFTFTVSDGVATSTPATITITVTAVNDAPLANAGSATVPEDGSATITLSGSDVDGDSLTFTIASGPTNGTLSAVTPTSATTADVTYTPNPNYGGPDSFTFTVSDSVATSAPATITITVTDVNDAPVANAGSATLNEDGSTTITLSGSDGDGDSLTFAIASGPTKGTLSAVTPTSATTANVSYTPNPNFNGTDSFTFTVSDSVATSAPATITITVTAVNDNPVANPDSASTPFETPVTIPVLANDTDVDGDTLTITGHGTAANGTITCSASNCTYTPNSGFSGTDSFTYTISDGQGGTASGPVTVTVGAVTTADLQISKSGPSTATRGETVTFTIITSNLGPGTAEDVEVFDSTPTGLTFVSNSVDCTTAFPCFLGTLAAGASRTIEATYSVNANAPSSITNTATVAGSTTEPNGLNNSSTATLTVESGCPTGVPQPVSPAAGQNVTSPITFAWNGVPGAIGYDVFVQQSAGAVNVASTTTETTAVVSLPAGSTTWWVVARFEECPPTQSANVSFTVAGGDCTDQAPALISPAEGASGLSSPVTFQWMAVSGASSYRVWVESEDSFPVVVGETSSNSLTATVPSGALNWYVQALIPGCPSNISEVRSLHVTQAAVCPTGSAVLFSPTEGANLDSPILFSWSSVPGAVRYAVWASINGDTESVIGTTEGEGNTTLQREMEPGSIDWFVEVFFDGCPSTRSAVSSFIVNEQIICVTEAPQLLAPADGASDQPGLVRFEWTPVSTAVGYRLWLRTNGFGEFEMTGSTLADTAIEIPVRGNMVEWYVEALFIGCDETRSVMKRFTLRPPSACRDDASELIMPIRGVTVTEDRVNLVWTAVDGADAYNVWMVREDGAQSRVGLTRGEELSVEVDLDEGAHEWWVTALFAGCSPVNSAHETFSVDLGIPEECETESELLLISPSEGAPNIVSPVIFEWTEVPGSTGYQIWTLEGESDTPQPLGGVREGTQAIVQTGVGTIRWYVEAIRSGCPPIKSAIQHFVVRASDPTCGIPDKPIVFTPQRVAGGTTYRVSWGQVPGATVYEIQESTSRDFQDLPVRIVRGTSSSFMHVVELGSETYFYRVRAIGDCNGERGFYSQLAMVTVEGSSGGFAASGLRLSATAPGRSETIELNKDAFSQSGVEEFRVVLRSPTDEPETVRIVSDQSWITVVPDVVTLTPEGVAVTVRAEMSDLPLGSSEATLRFEPVGGGKTASQTGSTPVSVSLVSPVASTGKNEPLPESLIVPAVAHTSGGASSTWLSDIRLTNVGAVSQKYQIHFTPAGVDGTQTGKSTTLDVQPGSTVALNDVLENWFGAVGANAAETGMLEIRPMKSSTSSSIGGLASVASGGFTSLASSRTYNFTPNGTFGQFIPAIRFEQFVGVGTDGAGAPRLSMQQVSQSNAFRTNLGLVEASGKAVDALIQVFNSGGTMVGSFTVSLQPGEHKQLNSVLAEQGISLENGRIEVTATNGSGRLMSYGSVVDNVTNDPQLVPAVRLDQTSGVKWVLPGVADFETGLASWRTDVRILNADAAAHTVKLIYFPQNDPGSRKEASLTLGSGEIEVLDDLLASFFGETNSGGVVHVESETMANLVTTGRTYNKEETGGTFGQFIPAVNSSQAVGRGERALQVLQVEQSERFRANLGLAEVSGQAAQVEISVVIPGSKVTPRAVVSLAGNEFTQLVGILDSLGISEAYNARISVKVVGGNGRIVAYGSMIDNITQDPTYVPAQ